MKHLIVENKLLYYPFAKHPKVENKFHYFSSPAEYLKAENNHLNISNITLFSAQSKLHCPSPSARHLKAKNLNFTILAQPPDI